MKMKPIIYLTIVLLPISVFAQKDTLWQDSVYLQAKGFFTKVERIELIQLKPYCYTRKYRTRFFGITKKYKSCNELSIIRYNSKTDSSLYPIDTTHIGNRYDLKDDKFDYLFELLYKSTPSNTHAGCYNPRHGIIFYNSKGILIGFLEICFECHRIYALPETPNMGVAEGEKFYELKKLFDNFNN